ncbi:hypothetical protein DJ90_6134 [Paenibacillus macerans]|uniref:Uncharacterized protein n=1 Tax=Paenibacillus macerans TaxID=44252 RepID=A0A090ZLR9_PAEMA|nr:hypothetical protein DJ90_6134 [Paenibacillus macerans]
MQAFFLVVLVFLQQVFEVHLLIQLVNQFFIHFHFIDGWLNLYGGRLNDHRVGKFVEIYAGVFLLIRLALTKRNVRGNIVAQQPGSGARSRACSRTGEQPRTRSFVQPHKKRLRSKNSPLLLFFEISYFFFIRQVGRNHPVIDRRNFGQHFLKNLTCVFAFVSCEHDIQLLCKIICFKILLATLVSIFRGKIEWQGHPFESKKEAVRLVYKLNC